MLFYKNEILRDELKIKDKYKNKKEIVIEGNFEKDEIKGIFTFNNRNE
jgi:hypothetical protein